jgi:hypothetical protein
MVNEIPLSTYSLVIVAIIPFVVLFAIKYWRYRPLLKLEHTLLKLSPTTGKTRAFTLMPLNLKEEYVEVPRADGTLEILDYNGQASMVIETKRGFEYFFVNPLGTTRILTPVEIAGLRRVGDYTDVKDLVMEQLAIIQRKGEGPPSAGLLPLLLCLLFGSCIPVLIHMLGVL